MEGDIMSQAIYSRAVRELFQTTYGKLEDRDRIKVVQLFDRLLAYGLSIHLDDLRHLCRNAGYHACADDIGKLYDTLYLICHELESPSATDHWRPEIMDRILGRCKETQAWEVQQ